MKRGKQIASADKETTKSVKKKGRPSVPPKPKMVPPKDASKSFSNIKKTQTSKAPSKLSLGGTASKVHWEQDFPKDYIPWDGSYGEEPLGHVCALCEVDLSYSTSRILESSQRINLPGVALLPCGHAYHDKCLEGTVSVTERREPQCPICLINLA